MLFKVLGAEGRSCHGGDLQWSLPTQNADGTWTPGEWMPVICGDLVPCENGYHAARDAQVLEWLGPRLFEIEAEPDSESQQADNKIVMRGPVRLVREFANWNARTARLFAVWCARQALALIDNPDPRSVAVCDVAERFANGEATAIELAAAWDAAWDAARAAARAAAWDAAWAASRAAAGDAAWAAAGDAAWAAAGAAAWAASRAAAWDASRAAALGAQYEHLLDMIGR